MPKVESFICDRLEQTEALGKKIAEGLRLPACVYLYGQLGSGKTTLCKAIIAGLGVRETVTSPTYNLIQEYPFEAGVVYHMDLYRLVDPEELEFLGLLDLWNDNSLFLIEWPERGGAQLQPATHEIQITIDESSSGSVREIVLKSL